MRFKEFKFKYLLSKPIDYNASGQSVLMCQ